MGFDSPHWDICIRQLSRHSNILNFSKTPGSGVTSYCNPSFGVSCPLWLSINSNISFDNPFSLSSLCMVLCYCNGRPSGQCPPWVISVIEMKVIFSQHFGTVSGSSDDSEGSPHGSLEMIHARARVHTHTHTHTHTHD